LNNEVPSLKRKKRGQTLVEYSLIIALVAVAVVGALLTLSTAIEGNIADSNSKLQKAYSGSTP